MLIEIPRQIPSEEEAAAIESGGESTEVGSSSVMGGNFILNLILAASLNQLWSMLNGLQLSTHMGLFNLKFPSNANFLLDFMVNVATFDFMPVEAIWFFFDFPESGSFSLSFASSGYEYINLIENMGTCFFMVQIYLTQCCFLLILLLLMKCFKIYKVTNLYEKMKKQLFWSTALRFIFESYLELVICVTIGLLNLSWDKENFSVQYCTIFTAIFAAAVLILPIFASVFYYCKVDSVEEEIFREKYGTLYEGLQLDMQEGKRKSALIYPFLFILRRLLFMASVIFMADFTWSQIAIQFSSCFTLVIYFGYVWPFESHSLTKIEIFNELASILLCYMMLCFTDWIPTAQMRYTLGWVFIMIIALHLGTHLALMIKNTYLTAKEKARERYAKKSNSTPQSKEAKDPQ